MIKALLLWHIYSTVPSARPQPQSYDITIAHFKGTPKELAAVQYQGQKTDRYHEAILHQIIVLETVGIV